MDAAMCALEVFNVEVLDEGIIAGVLLRETIIQCGGFWRVSVTSLK